MTWTVKISRKLQRQIKKLPATVQDNLLILLRDINLLGPIRREWPNFGGLGRDRYHCHLKKGRPTYVAVWEVISKQVRLIEVKYVGTHEKAPY
jgi:mRNA-degrading endonuclease RelE of RelBE toxin-antitoxin system